MDYSSMWDPVSKLITDLRDDAAVAAIAGANPSVTVPRVRGQEPATGDAQPAASYRAFVVIVTLGAPRHPQVPVQRARHAVRCYGRTKEEAAALYAAASDVLHARGPRATGAGNVIYVTHDETGGEYSTDPDTGQPLYTCIIETVAGTQVLA